MGSEVTTISLNREEMNFLRDNNISPSRLIKNKVREMMDLKLTKNNNPELLSKIKRLVETIQKQTTFLDSKKLLEEYSQLDDGKNK